MNVILGFLWLFEALIYAVLMYLSEGLERGVWGGSLLAAVILAFIYFKRA